MTQQYGSDDDGSPINPWLETDDDSDEPLAIRRLRNRVWRMRNRARWMSKALGGAVLLCLFSLAGCNDKQKIGNAAASSMRAAGVIKERAANSRIAASEISQYADDIQRANPGLILETVGIKTRASAIRGDQDVIAKESDSVTDAASTIQTSLPNVENRGGFFSQLWKVIIWCVVALGIFVGCMLIDRLGFAPFVQAVWRWLAQRFESLVSKRDRAKAELIVKTADPDDPTTERELIAAELASNPVLKAQVEREKNRRMRRKAERTLVVTNLPGAN